MKKVRNTLASLMIGVLMTTGCFGHFALTTKLWQVNASLGSKWVQSLVFWVLAIIPAYEFAALLDTFIFNVIEFWGGHNVLSAGNPNPPPGQPAQPVQKEVIGKDGKPVKLTFSEGGRHVRAESAGKTLDLRIEPSRATIRDAAGKLLSEARLLSDGSVELRDSSGEVVMTRSADRVNALAALLQSGGPETFQQQLEAERGPQLACSQ